MINHTPEWMRKYASGQCISKAQGIAAYSSYHSIDGSADDDHEVEERMAPSVPLLRPYASRTGTKTTLANMREMNWSILISAAGVLRTEGFTTWA
ncbi:hypothetical protein [Pseudomonas syringae]|uniref:hypothetical protein n=1 Tax=Pseudomonas syringae TaxID=317 RepID=UPI001F30EB1A|nr:hypothetical protein [Pseudomonas syringae]MCF5371231.1 hypothetical protein [Pseudomonas syringae]MCF5381918.1 hypothetical protein [Pseudomonas syringae]MCF5424032.1 hypothetical protein [Pseudomonas syringae]MCF5454933.1 hypothetical protein [Pseudomonas syringae]MCF5459243.1 hypothetical protein [Pseudomonas syringae]